MRCCWEKSFCDYHKGGIYMCTRTWKPKLQSAFTWLWGSACQEFSHLPMSAEMCVKDPQRHGHMDMNSVIWGLYLALNTECAHGDRLDTQICSHVLQLAQIWIITDDSLKGGYDIMWHRSLQHRPNIFSVFSPKVHNFLCLFSCKIAA